MAELIVPEGVAPLLCGQVGEIGKKSARTGQGGEAGQGRAFGEREREHKKCQRFNERNTRCVRVNTSELYKYQTSNEFPFIQFCRDRKNISAGQI